MASPLYQVYNVEIGVANGSRHFGIYVDTEDNTGQLLQVRCAVGRTGMMFDIQYYNGHGPENLSTFVSKTRLGKVRMEDVDRLAAVCGAVAGPAVQYVDDACQCAIWVDEACMAARHARLLL
ncbi:hypothetical protein V8C35DRAFT_329278 [Trichoderma chlorosporum]